MRKTKPQIPLIILLTLLGIGAVVGGGILIISPGGELMGIPISILEKSPFKSFLFPGFLLFLILAVAPLFIVYGLITKRENKLAEFINYFKDMHWAWTFSIYTAFALVIWIQLEIVFLSAIHWLHTFYIFLALAIIFSALLPKVRDLYKKEKETEL